jgi:hypothetical protein
MNYETVALPLSYIGTETTDILCIAGFTVNPNGTKKRFDRVTFA